MVHYFWLYDGDGYTSAIVVVFFFILFRNNDIIRWSLAAIKVPSHLESPGLTRSDGTRPDGLPSSPGEMVAF